MSDSLRSAVESIAAELTETRRFLHQNPELSECESETAAFVARRLTELGYSPRTEVGGFGVVADLDGPVGGRRIAIRADMDALPIVEENDVPYRSRREGVMHACGHDGHTATLLGIAQVLKPRQPSIKGSIRFVFQPAEETVGGARRMCSDGALANVDAIVALHGWPHLEVGQIGVRSGPMMASADSFDIDIRGKGGHAAYPHTSVDPIVIAAELIGALQTIASREIDPNAPVVVTVTQVHAGTAYNVIPDTAVLRGTYRTLSRQVRESIPDRIRRIASGVCSSHGASSEVTIREGTPPVVNDSEMVALISRVAAEMLGSENVVTLPNPSMGAEDFAEFLSEAPGAMFRLGLGPGSPFHTPTFNFEDRALPVGVELLSRIALAYLEENP